jgi:hypothetical protein
MHKSVPRAPSALCLSSSAQGTAWDVLSMYTRQATLTRFVGTHLSTAPILNSLFNNNQTQPNRFPLTGSLVLAGSLATTAIGQRSRGGNTNSILSNRVVDASIPKHSRPSQRASSVQALAWTTCTSARTSAFSSSAALKHQRQWSALVCFFALRAPSEMRPFATQLRLELRQVPHGII